jgi:hypothetical protein
MGDSQEREAFKEKLKSIQWATVPGGSRQSNGKYYDREALKADGLTISKDEVMDKRSDFRRMYEDLDRETGL